MIIRDPKELGSLIKHVRTRRGLTQADLAMQVGASRKWIIDLESGKRTTDLSLVMRTLNVLGIALDAHERSEATSNEVDIDAIVDAARRGRR
jgi:y4mF family transcriptional regulator